MKFFNAMYIYIHIHMYFIYIYGEIRCVDITHICMYIYIYTCIYICMYIHICVLLFGYESTFFLTVTYIVIYSDHSIVIC